MRPAPLPSPAPPRPARARATARVARLAAPLLPAPAAASPGGCAREPADVAGAYTVNITNRANGCALASWTEGATASAIPVTITQAGARATADVGGGARLVLDALLGGHAFTGEVDGDRLELALAGTRAASMGGCASTQDLNGTRPPT